MKNEYIKLFICVTRTRVDTHLVQCLGCPCSSLEGRPLSLLPSPQTLLARTKKMYLCFPVFGAVKPLPSISQDVANQSLLILDIYSGLGLRSGVLHYNADKS